MKTPDHIEIQLLGGFTVRLGGTKILLPGRKTAALLAILALRPGVPIARERLTDLLWSRSAPEQARGSLRQALAQLRKTFDAVDVIETAADGLWIRPERVEVDAARVEEMLENASTESIEQAVTLYSGELLENFVVDEAPFEDWRRAEGQQLQRRAMVAFGALLERYCEQGELAAATALGERLLAIDPSLEQTHQALMRLHLKRGALGAAMVQYERCREALHSRLGVPPSAQTEALRQRIRVPPTPVGQTVPQELPLLATLPFTNLSDDPGQAYFALGFTEDVIRALSRFRSVRIMAAHSSFAAVDAHSTAREAAERLGARYLLTGSVRRASQSLRIGADLVDAGSGHVLWSQNYDLAPTAVLAAQDDISRGVATTLAARIDDDRLKRAAGKPFESLECYDCWLRGMAELQRGTPDSHEKARILFRRSLELDAGFARAHSGLSLTYFNEWSCAAWARWEETQQQAFEHARNGAALDDSDPVTHFVLGRVLLLSLIHI